MTEYPFGKYKFYVSTGYVGSEDEEIIHLEDYVSEEEWESMNENDRAYRLMDLHEEWLIDKVDAGYYYVDG